MSHDPLAPPGPADASADAPVDLPPRVTKSMLQAAVRRALVKGGRASARYLIDAVGEELEKHALRLPIVTQLRALESQGVVTRHDSETGVPCWELVRGPGHFQAVADERRRRILRYAREVFAKDTDRLSVDSVCEKIAAAHPDLGTAPLGVKHVLESLEESGELASTVSFGHRTWRRTGQPPLRPNLATESLVRAGVKNELAGEVWRSTSALFLAVSDRVPAARRLTGYLVAAVLEAMAQEGELLRHDDGEQMWWELPPVAAATPDVPEPAEEEPKEETPTSTPGPPVYQMRFMGANDVELLDWEVDTQDQVDDILARFDGNRPRELVMFVDDLPCGTTVYLRANAVVKIVVRAVSDD